MRRGTTVGMLLIAVMVMFLSGCGKDRKNDTKEEVPKYIPFSFDYKRYTYDDGERKLTETGSRDFDPEGRLLSVSRELDIDNAVHHRTEEHTFTYDKSGRVESEIYSRTPDGGEKYTVREEHTTFFDDTDAVVTYEWKMGKNSFRQENTIGPGGEILSEITTEDGVGRYTVEYDSVSRKVTCYDWATDSVGYMQKNYKYIKYFDESGRVIRWEAFNGYDPFIPLIETTRECFYDGDSEVCTEEHIYSDLGFAVGTYRYDSEGRVVFREWIHDVADVKITHEELTEWTTDPELPGITVKIVKLYRTESDRDRELVRETRYRKMPVTSDDQFRSVYDPVTDPDNFFRESGKYYYYDKYFEYDMSEGQKEPSVETTFSEKGIIKKRVEYEGTGDSIARMITEYDDHGNPLKRYYVDPDGIESIREEYEYTYR